MREQHGSMYNNIHEQRASRKLLYDPGNSDWGSVITQRGGNGQEAGGKFKREGT